MPVVDLWHKMEKQPDGSRKKVRSSKYGRGKRWAARYRALDGEQKSPVFDTQEKARQHLKQVEGDLARGQYVDPKAGQVLLEDFARKFIANASIDEATRYAMEQRFQRHIYPLMGRRPMNTIRPSDIQNWIRGRQQELGDRTIRTMFENLSSVFSAAVDDDVLAKNPCRAKSVKAPSPTQKKIVPWPVSRVVAVRAALPERYRALVDMGVGCGLRQGEAFGVADRDLDFAEEVLRVRRQVKIVRNTLCFAPPKGGKERDVPLPKSVAVPLAEHMQRFPPVAVTLPWKKPDGKPVTEQLVFTGRERKALNKNYVNPYLWKPALASAGVIGWREPGERFEESREHGFHALRHLFASLVLSGGANIRDLADYLGHADPGFTLRTYVHMMPTSSQKMREAIDSAWNAADGL
ncbi:site-specific integrase [Nocardiopsis sp. TNDT3]|uniref:tyrosine-type recombinase/integrase n=1 Tax=Nocardiopsis sp. TNDT3 TaxID=2249354 RepID=UPI000E3E326F|nr:site-specific integrase [Nocardiopsis sp. TNDT3]